MLCPAHPEFWTAFYAPGGTGEQTYEWFMGFSGVPDPPTSFPPSSFQVILLGPPTCIVNSIKKWPEKGHLVTTQGWCLALTLVEQGDTTIRDGCLPLGHF